MAPEAIPEPALDNALKAGNVPLSVYVHIPWCAKKCPYCDFNSHEAKGELPEQAYLAALELDLVQEMAGVQDRQVQTIFLGGGTPSLVSPDTIAQLISMLNRHLDISPAAEITMEANPGTTDLGKFAGFRKAGINRLSIGVQSFQDDQLNLLGRIHSRDEAKQAFEQARSAGFDNINIDLMHGLPNQSLKLGLSDLTSAINLKPEHISWYQLTIEPNTVFFKRPPALPAEATLWALYQDGRDLLQRAGYQRYEVSAFAKPGKQARHNLNYWNFGDYIGIGAGAHGKITHPWGIERRAKTRLPDDYIKAQKVVTTNLRYEDDQAELVLEYLMNALRLEHGFDLKTFSLRTGLAPGALDAFISEASKKALIEVQPDCILPTEKGNDFLNELLLIAAGG